MLELLMTIGTGLLSGGATGLIGVAIQRFFDFKNKQADIEKIRLQQEHEVKMREADAKVMDAEWAGRLKVADREATGAENVADANAFAASFGLEPKRFSDGVKPTRGQGWILVLLDAFRGSIRPGMTVYLAVITTAIYNELMKLMTTYGTQLSAEQVFDLTKLVTGTIIYLFTTCTLWWFGTRNKGAPG